MSSKIAVLLIFFGLMFGSNIYSQNLYLSAKGATESETKVIDSLFYQKKFIDYASLQTEISSIKNRLVHIGYIESELINMQKENDSSYLAEYDLSKRYNSIRLYFDNSINKNILKLVSTDIYDNYFEIDITSLEETLKLLNAELSNQGDPFTTLQLSNIKKMQNNTLYADLIISFSQAR